MQRGRVLGKGNFGVVYEGTFGDQRVAMKELNEGADKAVAEATLMRYDCVSSVYV